MLRILKKYWHCNLLHCGFAYIPQPRILVGVGNGIIYELVT